MDAASRSDMGNPLEAADHGQAAVVALLLDPRTHPEAAGDIRHLQTHISHVVLAGPYAYKLKKAVRLPFLDFATLAARERFCREEVRLNRRLAAPIYLDVLPVTREEGALRLGGSGDPVDWVVRMRRLPAERCLAELVARGAVAAGALERIAAVVAAFHAAAPVAAGGDPDALVATWTENLDGVRTMIGRHLAAEDFDVLEDFGRTFVLRHDAVLRARPGLGHVREGHGDLRADHVYLLDDALPPVADAPAVPAGIYVVDCIEFSQAFRSIDVAADVAFLAMELESLGRPDLAACFVGSYAEAAGDLLVPALVPYYACHRATVRGKVEGIAAGEAEVGPEARARAAERARAQLALAGRYAWRSGEAVVVACAGLSGTGKSAVAGMIGGFTGWRVVSSDVTRKAAPGDVRYDAAARAGIYAALRREVERALGARESLVVDATFLARAERERLARTARGFGARHLFVECAADEAVVRRRLDARDARAVSDARWDVYVEQRRTADPFAAAEPLLRVETSGALAGLRPSLVRRLWRWRQGRPVAADERG